MDKIINEFKYTFLGVFLLVLAYQAQSNDNLRLAIVLSIFSLISIIYPFRKEFLGND